MASGGSGSSQPPPPPPPPPPEAHPQQQAARSGGAGGWQQSSPPQRSSSDASPSRTARPFNGLGKGSAAYAWQAVAGHASPGSSQQLPHGATASPPGGASAAPVSSPAASPGGVSAPSRAAAQARWHSGVTAGGGSLSPATRMPGIPGTGAGLGVPIAASCPSSPGGQHQQSAAAGDRRPAEAPRPGLVIDIGTDSE